MTPGLDPTASRGLSPPALAVDLHMHTTTSDGRAPLADMIAQAERLDLSGMGVSDHVRSDTDWVPEYVRAVRSARHRAALPVRCGVEAKILDTRGRLDLPHALAGVDYVLVADHRVPALDGPLHPADVRSAIDRGELPAAAVVDALIEATVRALESSPLPAIIAHLFSVLPKCGLTETAVGKEHLNRLAATCRRTASAVEINEKWRCPSSRVVRMLARQGVLLTAGSDAHAPAEVARWSYVRAVVDDLAAAA